MQPDDLLGTFVVETGIGQAWPFVGFTTTAVTPVRSSGCMSTHLAT